VLEKYFRDADEQSENLDTDRLTVVYMGDDGQQHSVEAPHLTLGQMLAGKSQRDLWTKMLTGKTAAPRENAAADAEILQADVACGD
jgi:hypothetical protein